MQNRAFRARSLEGYYLFLEISPAGFIKLLQAKKKLPLSGFNLTVPHKEAILPYLDRASHEVKAVRACNTVCVKNGLWYGHNTDIFGFTMGLRDHGFKTKGKDVVIIGAGGAARAVLYALLRGKVRSVIILNRTLAKARRLTAEFAPRYPSCLFGAAALNPSNSALFLSGKDLVVNTTSLGLKRGDSSPVQSKDFPRAKRGAVAYDLVYGQPTHYLAVAKQKGYKTIDGLPMLLYQGAKAFEIWTGKRPPVSLMRQALLQTTKGKN